MRSITRDNPVLMRWWEFINEILEFLCDDVVGVIRFHLLSLTLIQGFYKENNSPFWKTKTEHICFSMAAKMKN